MRLIDADLFIEKVMDGTYIYLQANKVDVIVAINSEVTVERPQGEWIKEEDKLHSKCSLCGFKYADYGILFNFCPNCGADMRGVAHDT